MSEDREYYTPKIGNRDGTEYGITCRRCGCAHCPVIYTRQLRGSQTLRKRRCRYCGHEFTTSEKE